MADVCGPFSLEGLDQFNNLDDLAFSLDSPVWSSADTCIFDVTLSTTATASVIAVPGLLLESSASITCSASASSDVIRVRNSSASVSASAAVEADAIRMRLSQASINATAISTCLGGVEYEASASISCTATVRGVPWSILSGVGRSTGRASASCVAVRLGDNWSDESAGSNTWEVVPTGANVWAQVPQGNNTWLRQG